MFYYCIFDWNYMLGLHLQSYEICFAIVLVSFLFVAILNALTFMSFVSFRTHIFGNKILQLLVHFLN